MNKWEIVRGTAVDWKHHKAWWVLTFFYAGGVDANGQPRVYEAGPYLVKTFDGTDQLWIGIPEKSHVLFAQERVSGRNGSEPRAFGLPHELVWARMPVVVPAPPNVRMCYEREPWLAGCEEKTND